MNDASGRQGSPSNVRHLADAIRKVRLAEAERADVVAELRDTERARLADELRGVFAEVREDDDQFIAQIDSGSQPRFWIDMTSFVAMARDRRSYRFVKDTRLGRTVILETADLDAMADCVMHYVAERIIERERALEGDWLLRRAAQQDAPPRRERRSLSRPAVEETSARAPSTAHGGWIAAAFLAGILVGVAALLAYAWVHVGG